MTLLVFISVQLGFAQVATSTNYQLQSDSINFGGGLSTSTNYTQESTFGEIGTGRATSTTYQLRAGYQQMQEVYIALSAAADVTMSPEIGGITGGTSNGSTSVVVTTDSPSGYSLTIEAEGAPAMQRAGGGSIPNYAPGGASPDFAFVTPPSGSAFGFSPVSVDTVDYFLDDGSSNCFSGSSNTPLACWEGLSTTPREISQGTGSNHPVGATTTIYFRVGVSGSAGVTTGLYTATTTLTALPL